MSKVESTTSSGAQLPPNDDPAAPSTGLSLKDVGEAAVSLGEKSFAWMVPYSAEDLHSTFSDAAHYLTHSDGDIEKAFQQMKADPKKAFNSMNQSEASWLVSTGFSDDQRKSVLNSLVRSGLTNKVEGQPVPADAPKPPALFEVNDRQPPSLQKFLHETNVRAARDYDSAYDAYADKTANPAPYVNLSEPGNGASLEEEMSMHLSRSASDYLSGKLADATNAVSVSKQARKLSPGDEMQVQFGFEGVADGFGAGTTAALKIKREADGYRVSPQGSVSVGGKINDDFKFSAGGTWGGEYHCKTLNDVDRLANLLKSQATGRQLSSDDQAFLDTHCSGLDLKGSGALKLAAEFSSDLKLSASAKADASLHVDLEARTITVSQKFSSDMSAQLSSKKGVISGNPEWKTTSSFDSGLTGDVTVTLKYSLPSDASLKDLARDPSDALSWIAGQAKQVDSSVKIHIQNGTTNSRAVDLESKPSKLDLKGVLDALEARDTKAAAEKLVAGGKTTIKTDAMTTAQYDLSPKIGTSLDSVTLGFKSQRIHHDQKEVGSFREALDFLKR